MANLCNNIMCIYSDTENSQELKKVYNLLKEACAKSSSLCIRDMVAELRTDLTFEEVTKEMEGASYETRGWVYSEASIIYEEATKKRPECIKIEYESKWSPCDEFWDFGLEPYKSLHEATIGEEPGCEVYINTDTTGKFFPERYIIDMCLEGISKYDDKYHVPDEYYIEYYENKKQVVKDMNKFFGKSFVTFKDVSNFFEELMKISDENDFGWFINFNKYVS